MRTKKNIRRFLAGFLVIVFAISITPRNVLHYLFASHKDAAGTTSASTANPQISKATYNCNCDNIVAESPFTQPVTGFELYKIQPFALRQKTQISLFYSTSYFLFALRGPPSES